ncbi:MAG: hypothetical protein WKG07_45255 [Hymenobacter sp.]
MNNLPCFPPCSYPRGTGRPSRPARFGGRAAGFWAGCPLVGRTDGAHDERTAGEKAGSPPHQTNCRAYLRRSLM